MANLTRLAGILALLAVLMTSTPADALGRADPGWRRHDTVRVKMADRYRNVFRPRVIEISRGDTVVWINVGAVTHTATTDAWDSGAVAPGGSYRRRFRRVGTFAYVCVIHPEMTGRVVVT